MNDATIVSRMILGARFDPELVELLRKTHGLPKDVQINMNVFETTVARGERTARVLCCWSGGKVEKEGWQSAGDIALTLAGRAAISALSMLPACMDAHPVAKGRLVLRELRLGKTPLRDKVIDAILDAQPGDRIAFVGDLAGELDGKMSLAFNPSGEPITVED
jgi:hypothetical protein